MSSDETSALSAGVSHLDRESWTPLVESYASQILHVSIVFILLEHLRPEICYVALWQYFLQVDLLSLHTLIAATSSSGPDVSKFHHPCLPINDSNDRIVPWRQGALIYFLFCDLRRGRRGSVSTMTHNQCYNVCDWKTTERDQLSEAQLSHPTCTRGKTSFRLAIPLSKSGKASFQPSGHFTTNKEAHKQSEGNYHFGEGTKCSTKLCPVCKPSL